MSFPQIVANILALGIFLDMRLQSTSAADRADFNNAVCRDTFHIKHGLVNPVEGWKEKGINPLPPYIDTGVNVVTKENVDVFYV